MTDPTQVNFQHRWVTLESETFAVYQQVCSIGNININTRGFKNILLLNILKFHDQLTWLIIETGLTLNFLNSFPFLIKDTLVRDNILKNIFIHKYLAIWHFILHIFWNLNSNMLNWEI